MTINGGVFSVKTYGFVDVENKVRVLDEVDPEAEGKTVGLPGVHQLK